MGSPHSSPQVSIQLLAAQTVDAFRERKNLIVGQKGASGTAADKVLIQDVHAMRDSDIRTLLGNGELYYRILAWRAAANVSQGGVIPQLDVIPANANGAGTAATNTITITGTATGAGTLRVSYVDERQFSVNVTVASGDANTAVAAAINTALGTLTNPPFTSGVSTNVCTLTASDVGTVGNFYGIRVTGTVPGITIALADGVVGANDPTVTDVLDAIDGRRYVGLSWPENWAANLNTATDLMDTRFNAPNAIMDGMAFHGRSLTFADAQTAVSTLNTQSLVMMGNSVDADGPEILQPADWVSAYFMASRDKRLSTNANISDLVVTRAGRLDTIGGPALASLPYFNTPLRRTPVTLPADLYSSTEQITLANAGFTSFGVNEAGNAMIMGEVVTTYTTDSAGNDDNSFHYLNYVDTGSVCREIFFRTLRAAYAQSRLTEGDLVEDRSIENASSIKEQLQQIYRFLAGLVLVQDGTEAEQFFADNTVVTIDLVNRRVTINGPLPIVTQIGNINYPLQLSFTTQSTGLQITV